MASPEFFENLLRRERKIYLLLAVFLVGLSEGIQSLRHQLLGFQKEGRAELVRALDDWPVYWVACLAVGLVFALLIYFVGGWIYQKRVEWSGGTASAALCRRLFIYTSLIPASVVLLKGVRAPIVWPTPVESFQDETLAVKVLAVLLLFAIYWSIYASYRGVLLLARPSRKTMTLMWFLLLPAVWLTAFYLNG